MYFPFSLVSLSKTFYIGIKIDVQIVWLKYMYGYINIYSNSYIKNYIPFRN